MDEKKINRWKALALSLIVVTAVLALLFISALSAEKPQKHSDAFTDEMKMPAEYNYDDQGAAAFSRKGDHPDSPYFNSVDFYNMDSSDTLTLLPHFKTYQQTSWWSCGVAAELMVMEYYEKKDTWNEKTLADLRSDHSATHSGTCLEQMLEMIEGVDGWDVETTYDYANNLDSIDLDFIKNKLKDGIPVIVGWNDWGGHWQVIIGYDELDTPDYQGDDVLIMADPFDTTDHNQDGYGSYSASRFIYNFTFYDFFGDPNHQRDKCFLAIKPTD